MKFFALGIGLDGEGSHPAAWRRANHPPSASQERGVYRTEYTSTTLRGHLVTP